MIDKFAQSSIRSGVTGLEDPSFCYGIDQLFEQGYVWPWLVLNVLTLLLALVGFIRVSKNAFSFIYLAVGLSLIILLLAFGWSHGCSSSDLFEGTNIYYMLPAATLFTATISVHVYRGLRKITIRK